MIRSTVSAIAIHAETSPDRLAICDGSTRQTYAELDQHSSRLATILRQHGAGPGSCVGLYLDRSASFVVAALAVWKTGAAYLPLDPATPPDRVAHVLADAGASLVLTEPARGPNLPTGSWDILHLDRLPDADSSHSSGAVLDATSDQLAYVIYTSGSTGRPKGVEITHGNLAHLIEWHRDAFQLSADDRVSQVAGLGFDAAVWEIWPTLVSGASLHLADEATRRSPLALRDWLVNQRITIAFVPTVLAEPLLHTDWPANTALRYLLTGADTLRRGPAAGLPFTLVNNYGPTECTVVATSGEVSSEVQGPPTIGRPIGQTRTFILGEDLKPVASGEPGELCLAGPLVGRGYRNNPEETEKRFVHLVTDDGLPVRIYRTGDRVRQLESGEIAFLGRLDDQIKLRGFRIEPGEIVTCLSACPGVLSSAVVARDLGNDGPELVAYVVALPDAQLTVAGLREELAPRLPDYMVPAHYVALPTLPVTSGGKLDRAALPAPTADNLLPLGTTEDATSQAIPNAVAALVAALLNQPRVDPQANFFMLGGHSMLAAQLVAQIRDRFGVSLTLRQLFNAPTVAALASVVAQQTQARK